MRFLSGAVRLASSLLTGEGHTMIKTIIHNARQDALEPQKPAFVFYFADEPQYAAQDARGRLAHMLKCYRAAPDRYSVRKAGLHSYVVTMPHSSATAIIEARGV
jgi:hypothetical protein